MPWRFLADNGRTEVTEHCRRKAIQCRTAPSLFCPPMHEDSSAPNRGAGGSQCNAEVSPESVVNRDAMSGSFAGRKRIAWSSCPAEESDRHGSSLSRRGCGPYGNGRLFGRAQFAESENGLPLDYSRAALQSLRAAGTREGQHLAQLLDQENLPSILGWRPPSMPSFAKA
jgi:hypothetical protein